MSETQKPPRPYDTFLDWHLSNPTPRKGEILPYVLIRLPWALSPEAHLRARDFALAELADLRQKVADQTDEIERLREAMKGGAK